MSDATLVDPADLHTAVRRAIADADRLEDDATVWDDMATASIRAVARWLETQSWYTPSDLLLEALSGARR